MSNSTSKRVQPLTLLLPLTLLFTLACESPRDAEALREAARAAENTPTSTIDEQNDPATATSGRAAIKHGFVQNLEALTESNRDFRRVLYTAKHCQLVLMTIPAEEHIGLEKHEVDQFFRIESGKGEVIIDGNRTPIGAGSGIIVPAGSTHDVVNRGSAPLKLYTLYSPPNHRDGVVHHTRADAEADTEHFDGQTSE